MTEIDTDVPNIEQFVDLASNGSDYQLVWIKNDGVANSVFGRLIDVDVVVSPIASLEADSAFAAAVRIVSNGTGFLVGFKLADQLFVTSGANQTWAAPQQLSEIATNVFEDYVLASGGGEYAAAWIQPVGAEFVASVFGIVRQGGVWADEPTLLNETLGEGASGNDDSLRLQFDASDGGYVALWLTQAFFPDSGELWSISHDATTGWGTAENLGTPVPFQFPQPYAASMPGTRPALAWIAQRADDSGHGVFAALRAAGAWGTPDDVATTVRGDNVQIRHVLSNGAGQTLAIWQQNRGDAFLVYAAVSSAAGVWGEPELLQEGRAGGFSGSVEAVVGNDTGFAVALSGDEDPVTFAVPLPVRVFNGSAWSAVTDVSAPVGGENGNPALVAAGDTYALAWVRRPDSSSNDPDRIYASIFENGVWGNPTELAASADGGFLSSPRIATNGNGYAVTWDESPFVVPVNVYDGTDWSGPQVVAPTDEFGSNRSPEIASDGTGYAVIWRAREAGDTFDNIHAAVSATGAADGFGTAERLSDDSDHAGSRFRIVANDNGYGVAWTDGDRERLFSSIFDGATWAAPLQHHQGVFGLDLVALQSSNSGFALRWNERSTEEFAPLDLLVDVYDGSAWSGATVLDTLDERAADLLEGGSGLNLASNGASFAAAWVNFGADDVRHVSFAVENNGAWTTQQIERPVGNADAAGVTDVGDTYTVVWAQPDPDGAADTALPWAHPDLP